MNTCVICFGDFTPEQSISCRDGNHSVCHEHFPMYIQQNITRRNYRATHGRVPCPDPECTSFFDDAQTAASLIRSNFSGPLEHYLHGALPLLPDAGGAGGRDAGALIEAL